MRRALALAALSLLALATGCPAPKAKVPSPTPPPSSGGRATAPITSAEKGRAKEAAMALGTALKARLGAALKAEGEAGGVKVCSSEAQALSKKIAQEQGVAMGRTSHRRRNVANVAPEWAEAWVASKDGKPHFARGPQGEVRALLPIKATALCSMCHGPRDDLSPGVRQAISDRYPQDEAVDFRPGDLRGWFWVELPAQGS